MLIDFDRDSFISVQNSS